MHYALLLSLIRSLHPSLTTHFCPHSSNFTSRTLLTARGTPTMKMHTLMPKSSTLPYLSLGVTPLGISRSGSTTLNLTHWVSPRTKSLPLRALLRRPLAKGVNAIAQQGLLTSRSVSIATHGLNVPILMEFGGTTRLSKHVPVLACNRVISWLSRWSRTTFWAQPLRRRA